jgi:hypothetical protein
VAGDRGDADHDVASVFSEADVQADVVLARAFVAAVESVTARSGGNAPR